MRSVHLSIKGKVQGVFYRASAKEKANILGIVGWVRNCADGTVECVAAGAEEAVAAFITWCETGPRGAMVTGVSVTEGVKVEEKDFTIRKKA